MPRKPAPLRTRAAALSAALLLGVPPLAAQTRPSEPDYMGTKEDRVLWVFPNYRTVDEARRLPPIGPREKLTIAFKDSFDPYAFPVAGLLAGVTWAEDPDAPWGRGRGGYGKLYFAALADQTMSNAMAAGVFPIMLHQDPRYFRLGRGGFWRRTGYAVSRIFVTRADGGEPEFNYSEFGGNAVMAATSNLYYLKDDRTLGNTAQRFGTQIAFDLIANVGKEFWPDVRDWLLGR